MVEASLQQQPNFDVVGGQAVTDDHCLIRVAQGPGGLSPDRIEVHVGVVLAEARGQQQRLEVDAATTTGAAPPLCEERVLVFRTVELMKSFGGPHVLSDQQLEAPTTWAGHPIQRAVQLQE